MIDIRVLGTLAIHTPGGDAPAVALTQPKRFALLLYLALAEPAGPKSRDSLLALLWPEADAESARHSLRNALYGLRQTLGEAAFVSRGERNLDGYLTLDASAIRCDALEVRRLIVEQRWEDAVASWTGDLAPGFHISDAPEFEQWLDDQRASLRRAVTEAAWRRVDELEKVGGVELVPAAQRAYALEPANEAGARRLMRFLDASGERAAALRAYEELADYLRRECETEPSAETRALARELETRPSSRMLPSPQEMPAGPQSPELRTVDSALVSLGASPRGKRISATAAAIAGALLMAGLVSLFALRPAGSAARHDLATLADSGDPVTLAESKDVFRLPARDRQDTSAYASYVRGLTLRGNIASRDTFAALVFRKPLYSPGYAGLAHSYIFMVLTGEAPAKEAYPLAEAAALQSIALDSTMATAYLALAMVELIWHWDVPRAGTLIDRALAIDPKDFEAHAIRGNWFRWQGEADSSLVEVRKAFDLDPLNPMRTNRVAGGLVFARRYAEAEAMYLQALRDYPASDETYGELADFYLVTGRPRDALETQRTNAEVLGDTAWLARLPSAASDSQAGRVLADQKREELRDLLDRKRSGEKVHGASLAFAYAYVRDTTQTLLWLDSLVVEHDPMGQNVLVNPLFDFLRDDPRYRAWEAKLPWRQDRER